MQALSDTPQAGIWTSDLSDDYVFYKPLLQKKIPRLEVDLI